MHQSHPQFSAEFRLHPRGHQLFEQSSLVPAPPAAIPNQFDFFLRRNDSASSLAGAVGSADEVVTYAYRSGSPDCCSFRTILEQFSIKFCGQKLGQSSNPVRPSQVHRRRRRRPRGAPPPPQPQPAAARSPEPCRPRFFGGIFKPPPGPPPPPPSRPLAPVGRRAAAELAVELPGHDGLVSRGGSGGVAHAADDVPRVAAAADRRGGGGGRVRD